MAQNVVMRWLTRKNRYKIQVLILLRNYSKFESLELFICQEPNLSVLLSARTITAITSKSAYNPNNELSHAQWHQLIESNFCYKITCCPLLSSLHDIRWTSSINCTIDNVKNYVYINMIWIATQSLWLATSFK